MADLRYKNGFTLIEILVVVGVIAILASMVVTLTLRVENQSKENTLANGFVVLRGALREYYEFTGKFPEQPERDHANAAVHVTLMYGALEQVPASREILKGVIATLVKSGKGQASATTIRDPWGTVLDYVYVPQDSFPELISAGPDKTFGTGDDISSKGK